jgi:hypothetical protein
MSARMDSTRKDVVILLDSRMGKTKNYAECLSSMAQGK